ncbi:unnamed protein product [Mortierella alpina]
MARKKTVARKTRQTVQATHSPYPARSSSTVSNSTSASKAASAAPSNASSPSPQLADPVQVGRRKSMPRRSPSQNNPSQGIVFSFVFQKDPALSMSVDIRSYDQQFGPPEEAQGGAETAPTVATGEADLIAATAVTSSAASAPSPLAMSHADSSASSVSSHANSSSTPGASSASPHLRMAGEQWSSDPSAFRSSNVYDESRNLLILHTRRPAPVIAVAPTQSSTSPFTPALSQSGSSSFSGSPSASSPASAPSTPSASFPSILTTPGSCSQAAAAMTGDSISRKLLPLDIINSQPTRYLNVRGLGGANRGRKCRSF